MLRRQRGQNAELPAPRPAERHLRQPLRRQPAMHACAPRHAHRPRVLPASPRGGPGAFRQLVRRDPAQEGRLLATSCPTTTLLEDGGGHVPQPIRHVRVRARQERHPWKAMSSAVGSACSSSITACSGAASAGTVRAVHDQPRVHPRLCGISPRCAASTTASTSCSRTAARRTAAPHRRRSIRTSRSSRPTLPRDYPTSYRGPILDWPPYARVTEAPEDATSCAPTMRHRRLCDHELGRPAGRHGPDAMWTTPRYRDHRPRASCWAEHDCGPKI